MALLGSWILFFGGVTLTLVVAYLLVVSVAQLRRWLTGGR
jgi:hypothetical protein